MGIGQALFTAARVARGWSNGAIARHFFIRGALLVTFDRVVNLANYAYLVRESPSSNAQPGEGPAWRLRWSCVCAFR